MLESAVNRNSLAVICVSLVIGVAVGALLFREPAEKGLETGQGWVDSTKFMAQQKVLEELQRRLQLVEAKLEDYEIANGRERGRENQLAVAGSTRKPTATALSDVAGTKKASSQATDTNSQEEAQQQNQHQVRLEDSVAQNQKFQQEVTRNVAELKAQLRFQEVKNNKEPELSLVSEILELNGEQRAQIESDVRDAQVKIRDVLEQPTESGVKPLDILVEAMALGKLGRPEAQQRYGQFLASLAQQADGQQSSYGALIQEAKTGLSSQLQANLSQSQFQKLQDWKFDPDRIKGIEDSPWNDLEQQMNDKIEEWQTNAR